MIFWRFYIKLFDNLSPAEIEKFRREYPDLGTVDNSGEFCIEFEIENRDTALFLFHNTPGIFPLNGDKRVAKIDLEPILERRTIYPKGN